MPVIDDLGRPFFGILYELRIPVGVGSAAAFIVIAVVARRRGWFASARRHPRRAGTLAVVAIMFGVPLTWYLASPIFIRSALVESPPAIAAATAPPAATASPSTAPSVAAE